MSQKTVLVVEDDEDIRQALSDMLSFDGYHVLTAVNGKDGLEKIRQSSPPNLILLDIRMPVMDGREFLKIAVGDPALSKIPIVVISATEDAKDLPGTKAVIKKPIDVKLLVEVIERHIA